MEPQIRYVTSADGTKIAYAVLGEGEPLIAVWPWGSSLTDVWWPMSDRRDHRSPNIPSGWCKLVSSDRRGNGASEREATNFTLEAEISDIAALANELKLEEFDLFGDFDGACIAAAYAGQHPQTVRRLVLSAPYSHGGEIGGPERATGLIQLIRSNWQLGRRTLADVVYPRGPIEDQVFFANMLQRTMNAEIAARHIEFQSTVDVRLFLNKIRAPTLIIHTTLERRVPIAASRAVAQMIPDARLVQLEGSVWGTVETRERSNRAIREFLTGERPAPSAVLTESRQGISGTAVILFADIVDSTALTERLGDAAFRARARDLDTALRTVIREHSGTPIEGKLLGDGVLAVFTSARQAIEAALACGAAGSDAGLPLHLGLHAGDVIREDNNVYGGAINIAARIAGLSAAGEVLVSETVRSLARTSAGVRFEDSGEQALKGVGEPVRVWVVREGGA